MKFYK